MKSFYPKVTKFPICILYRLLLCVTPLKAGRAPGLYGITAELLIIAVDKRVIQNYIVTAVKVVARRFIP